MKFALLFGLYVVFLCVYWFFVWAILWHARQYTLPHDYSRYAIRIFLGLSVILNIIGLVLLLTLPV